MVFVQSSTLWTRTQYNFAVWHFKFCCCTHHPVAVKIQFIRVQHKKYRSFSNLAHVESTPGLLLASVNVLLYVNININISFSDPW